MPKDKLTEFAGANYTDLRAGGYDPVERLKDQDIDGVAGEVLYPTYGMSLYAITDRELQSAAFNAYNEWMVEFCSHAPARLKGLALISVHDVTDAVKELQRWYRRGLRGAMIAAVPPEGTEYSDPRYDPLWSAAAEIGLPISIHTLTSARKPNYRYRNKLRAAAGYPESPIEVMLTFGEIVTSQHHRDYHDSPWLRY